MNMKISHCKLKRLDFSEFKYFRINHSTSFAKGKNHINGIENFWNQAKYVLRKYNGINCKILILSFLLLFFFSLFLVLFLFFNECDFEFNYGSLKEQIKVLRYWCEI